MANKTTTCRDCGKPITFLKSPTGRWIAINPNKKATGVAQGALGAKIVTVYQLHRESCKKRQPEPVQEEPEQTLDDVVNTTFPESAAC